MSRVTTVVKDALHRHRLRHTPSGFEFLLSDRIGFIMPETWDGLTRDRSVFMSRRYLSVLEEAGPDNLSQRYAVIFKDGEPAAAVAAQVVTVTPSRLRKVGDVDELVGLRKKLLHRATAPLNEAEQRILVCGNLLSWGCHGVAISPAHNRKEIWSGVAEALYRMRRADRLSGETDLIMVKDITDQEREHAANLATFSYRRLETEPNMVLALKPTWSSYDDYLAAMTSKYRRTARDIDKDVLAAGCKIESIEITPQNAAELYGLYMQVHQRAKTRLFTLRPDFLQTLAAAFGPDLRCTAISHEGRIVGFITTLKDGKTAIAYYVGFDSELNQKAPLYFRLLLAAVEDGIALGCSRVSLGRTALEPKAKLGAMPEPMEIWIRHRVPMLNMLVKAAVRGVHHEEAPARNPFK